MAAKLQPRAFRVEGCTKVCSLSPEQTTPDAARLFLKWFCEGANNQLISEKALIIGFKLSNGSVGRHRANHLVPIIHDPTIADPIEGPPLSDVEILEAFIQKGAASLRLTTGRIGPEMTLKAMELKYKLTQGNAFQGFLDAVNNAFMGEPEGAAEGLDAVMGEDEQGEIVPS